MTRDAVQNVDTWTRLVVVQRVESINSRGPNMTSCSAEQTSVDLDGGNWFNAFLHGNLSEFLLTTSSRPAAAGHVFLPRQTINNKFSF